jgi:transcriptional regulator GlxA family with amidase domain
VLNAAILIFRDAEVLDFCGPFEVLASTRMPGPEDRHDRGPAFDVFTVAKQPEVLRCRAGLLVQPNYSFATCPPVDVLVVPGGRGVLEAQEDDDTVTWVKRTAKTSQLTTSVCTGAFLLARAGLLDGKPATTHWAELAEFQRQYTKVSVRDDFRIVDLGNVITSAGVSAGLDMSLHLVERLFGRPAAEEAARGIEYRWQPVPTMVVRVYVS